MKKSPHIARTREHRLFQLDKLEERALLSSAPLAAAAHGGQGGTQIVSGNGTTPISDLTGNPLTISQVVGLPAVQFTDFDGIQRLITVGQHGVPAVQHLDDIATLTSSSSHVKLQGYSVSIDWGDGTPATKGTLVVDKSGLIHVKGLHSYAAVGTFNVVVTLSQTTKSGGVATTNSLTIDSTADVTQDSTGGVDIAPNTGVPFTGVVGNFSGSGNDPTQFAALINFGDGSKAQLGTVALNLDGTFSVTGTHTYSADGIFRISILVYQNPPGGVLHASPGNHGLHLGWRHSFVDAIFSTATVTSVVVSSPPTGP